LNAAVFRGIDLDCITLLER